MRKGLLLFHIVLVIVLNACKPTRHVQDGEYLISHSKIHLNENGLNEFEPDISELEAVIRQKPYRKILGLIPFHLSVWNYGKSHEKDKKFNTYLRENIGEAPEFYEPIMLDRSKEQLIQSLKNNGYFDARVEVAAFMYEKTVDLHYYVYSGPAYTVRRVSYSFEDTALIKEFTSGVKTTLTPGDRFDADQFSAERTRMSETMKNLGFFTFDKIHVVFDIDTNLPGERFDVSVRLRNLRISEVIDDKDTILEASHQKHYISKIYINESYDGRRNNNNDLDTILHRDITFLYRDNPVVRPTRLARNVFIKPNDLYSLDKSRYTYDRISALNNFRFIDLSYDPSDVDSNIALLDLKINLTKAPRQSMTVETIGTNRSGNLGVNASINYKNRNLFHGAEQFDWKVYGGLEFQRTNQTVGDQNTEIINNSDIYYTYEFGSQASITIPDFLFRVASKELPIVKEPKTSISLAADRQRRFQYARTLLNFSYQYTMRIRPKDQLVIAPIDLSVIQLDKDIAFEQQLKLTNNSLLINSYNNHIIPAGRISYSYTTQDLNKAKNFYYYRANFESAGNILRGLSGAFNLPYDAESNSYLIDSIAFAQYVKVDFDFSRYMNLVQSWKSVYRIYTGVGIPLQNLNSLPFERSFFAGGSNGIRGWRARGLGPGSLSDTATYGIDQVGEMQLEFNLEYRFAIIKQIEGAIFSDFGNIWILGYDPQRPGAEFDPKTFYKEIAVSPGAGIRLNFNFFVLRLDAGLQLKDPSLPEGERWLFQPKTKTEAYRLAANNTRTSRGIKRVDEWDKPFRTGYAINLAIGYPF